MESVLHVALHAKNRIMMVVVVVEVTVSGVVFRTLRHVRDH